MTLPCIVLGLPLLLGLSHAHTTNHSLKPFSQGRQCCQLLGSGRRMQPFLPFRLVFNISDQVYWPFAGELVGCAYVNQYCGAPRGVAAAIANKFIINCT